MTKPLDTSAKLQPVEPWKVEVWTRVEFDCQGSPDCHNDINVSRRGDMNIESTTRCDSCGALYAINWNTSPPQVFRIEVSL